mgnify:CR=1 FL=1
MDLQEASNRYRRAIAHTDNLIQVHRRAGTGLRGRRVEEVSINRAVVVITVATWQAAVQDMTTVCLDVSEPPAAAPFLPAYRVVAGRVRTELGAFSTANAPNSRRILQSVGFDPRPHWTWRQSGGRGVGSITLRPSDVERKIDDWLKVRHAIAHGHAHLPAVSVLQSVRDEGNTDDPSLRLVDAVQCRNFFARVIRHTGDALAIHLGVPRVSWTA